MKTTLLAAVLALAGLSATADAWTLPDQVARIPSTNLADMAAAVPGPNGPVIVYNPNLLERAPAGVQEFAFAHEYGHIVLGHLAHLEAQGIPQWAQALEKQADCYAATVIDDAAAEQAAELFETMQGPTSADARHPSGNERAALIRQCHARAHATTTPTGGDPDPTAGGTDDDPGSGTADGDDGAGSQHCHQVTRYHTVTTYQTVTVMEVQPVMRCQYVMTAWGPRPVCAPVMVPVPVTRQVPVTHEEPVTETVCD